MGIENSTSNIKVSVSPEYSFNEKIVDFYFLLKYDRLKLFHDLKLLFVHFGQFVDKINHKFKGKHINFFLKAG